MIQLKFILRRGGFKLLKIFFKKQFSAIVEKVFSLWTSRLIYDIKECFLSIAHFRTKT